MKSFLATLFLLISISTIHANTDDISLPEIANYGRGTIYDVVWHPIEDVIAVASGTGIWLYDTDFNTLGQLSDTNVDYVSWNDDGTYLASGYKYNRQCHIWETPLTNSHIFTIDDCGIYQSAWYGTQFAYQEYGSHEAIVSIYDMDNSTKTSYPIATPMAIRGIYWSPDGSQILLLAINSLVLLDKDTGDIIQTYLTGSNPTQDYYSSLDNAVLWNDEQFFVFCSERNAIIVETISYACEWNVSTNELIQKNQLRNSFSLYLVYRNTTLTSPTEFIYISSAPSPYANRLLWQRENSDNPFLPDISSNVDIVAYDFNPDQTKLLIASRDGRLIIYDTINDEVLRDAQPHLYSINDLAWHPNDGRLAVTGYGLHYETQIWQLRDDELEDTGTRLPFFIPQYIDWQATNDGSEITISGNSNGETVDLFNFGVIDGETYERISYSEGQSSNNPTYEETMPRVASNDGGREVLYDYRVNEIRVESDFRFEIQQGQIISNISWSSDDKWLSMLISSETTNTVLIWDTASWHQVYEYSVDLAYFSPHFAWSPDSQYLAFALESYGEVRVIDMNTLDERASIHSDYLTSILWSPDSHYLMVGSRQLEFYEIASTELVATIEDIAHVYDWRTDGTFLAGGNSNGTVQIWDMRSLVTR